MDISYLQMTIHESYVDIDRYIYIYIHIHRYVDELEESLPIGQHLHDGQYPKCSCLTLSILCRLADLATCAFTGRIGKSYLDGVQSHMWLFTVNQPL